MVYSEWRTDLQTVYIKILSEADRARGFFELTKRSRIGSLPSKVYQVRLTTLQILEDIHVDYRRATDMEVKDAHEQIRNPFAANPVR